MFTKVVVGNISQQSDTSWYLVVPRTYQPQTLSEHLPTPTYRQEQVRSLIYRQLFDITKSIGNSNKKFVHSDFKILQQFCVTLQPPKVSYGAAPFKIILISNSADDVSINIVFSWILFQCCCKILKPFLAFICAFYLYY